MIIRFCLKAIAGACLFASCASVHAATETDQSRGELLYSTHCIACHTTQVHWRDGRLATDWDSLTAQVRRWQRNTRLGWNEEDIAEVARYLNSLYYHFPSGTEEKKISLERLPRGVQ